MMQSIFHEENYGKLILIVTATLMWVAILILFRTYGYNDTWQLWKVPTQKLPFMDFRLIPGSAESFRKGFEPSLENPSDPNKRIFNYPAFWRLFFHTGITQADTVWISVSMISLFFIGVFLFPEKLSVIGALGMLLVVFSPASMLLYERGNVDLIVFFICAMIVVAANYSANITALLILFGAIVKMFPFFGITVLLKESKNKFWKLFSGCLVIFLVYIVATWSSVKASWNTTMRGDGTSYGTNVFVTRYGPAISRAFSQWFTPSQLDLFIRYGPLAVAVVLLLVIIILAFRHQQQPAPFTERNLAAFRMGASIYVGTFLLGNNWDYRLAFLVFVVPQLVDWMFSTDKVYRTPAWLSMFLVLASCWHFWILQISLVPLHLTMADSQRVWIILDETFNWLLFASLAYLMIASVPDWLKTQFGSFLPVKG